MSIIPDRCERCGFCVTSCQFSGITLGGVDKNAILDEIRYHLLEEWKETGREKPDVLVFVCERSLNLENVLTEDRARFEDAPEAAAMILPCIGVIASNLMETAFKAGAKGVVILGCRSLDCHYREGNERIVASLDPKKAEDVRPELLRNRTRVFLVSRFEDKQVVEDIKEFIKELKSKDKQKGDVK